MSEQDLSYDVVVVAGGSGSRLGGAVKADLVVGGERLVDRALAATSTAATRVLVGEGIEVPDDVVVTLEDPPAGGPAAGTAAGLAAVASSAPWTLLLASDLADPAAGVAALLAAAAEADAQGEDETDGICLAGDAEHPQWLFGIHRTAALQAAVAELDTVRDRSMKALLSSLRLRTVSVAADTVADIDTRADLERWSTGPGSGHVSRPAQMTGGDDQAARWHAWVELATAAVDADPSAVDITGIHVLTKQIAHRYDRPLAPVGSYILGLAVGAAQARGEEVDQAELRRAIAETIIQAPPVPQEDA